MKLAIPAALICSSFSLKPLWILKWLSFNVGDVDKLPQEAGKFSEGSFKILASPPLLEDFFPPLWNIKEWFVSDSTKNTRGVC